MTTEEFFADAIVTAQRKAEQLKETLRIVDLPARTAEELSNMLARFRIERDYALRLEKEWRTSQGQAKEAP